MSLLFSEFSKNESIKAAEFDVTALNNESLKRQINMILDVGTSGYEDTAVLKRVNLYLPNHLVVFRTPCVSIIT